MRISHASREHSSCTLSPAVSPSPCARQSYRRDARRPSHKGVNAAPRRRKEEGSRAGTSTTRLRRRTNGHDMGRGMVIETVGSRAGRIYGAPSHGLKGASHHRPVLGGHHQQKPASSSRAGPPARRAQEAAGQPERPTEHCHWRPFNTGFPGCASAALAFALSTYGDSNLDFSVTEDTPLPSCPVCKSQPRRAPAIPIDLAD